MKSNLYLVVMAGGSGTRFWPKSTTKKPKQLLSFGEGQPSLLTQTLRRFEGLVPKSRQVIVTNQVLRQAVEEQAEGARVLAEPQARNTAPCVYWAAQVVAQEDPEAVMLVMPSDHFIPKLPEFIGTVRAAAAWAAEHDDLVTLGVTPSRPETGYGYLKIGGEVNSGVRRVDAFVEKPNLTKAEEFVRSGQYLWNGGMFAWRASVILKAFDEFMPEMKRAWVASGAQVETAYGNMTATSIDFGVMEKAWNVVSIALDCGWDDLGSWISLEGLADFLGARRDGNVVTGGQIVQVDSSANIVDVPGKTVALVGVDDLIVVEHGQAVLVARKDRAQDIKVVVEKLKAQGSPLV